MTWGRNWSALADGDLQQLTEGGLDTPIAWAYAFEKESDEEVPVAILAYVESLCRLRRVEGGGSWEDCWTSLMCCQGQGASLRATVANGQRVASLSDLQLAMDQTKVERAGKRTTEKANLQRQQLYGPEGSMPVAWRPEYRWRVLESTGKEREMEEAVQRHRRVRQVLGVITETELPFASKVDMNPPGLGHEPFGETPQRLVPFQEVPSQSGGPSAFSGGRGSGAGLPGFEGGRVRYQDHLH